MISSSLRAPAKRNVHYTIKCIRIITVTTDDDDDDGKMKGGIDSDEASPSVPD